VVGGIGPRTMAVAARYADGWNVTGPTSADQYLPLAGQMRRQCDQAGRDRPLRYSVQLFTRDLDWPGLPALIDGFAAAGATELLFAPDHDRLSDELHRLATTIGLG
jgi:hypothetical protein